MGQSSSKIEDERIFRVVALFIKKNNFSKDINPQTIDFIPLKGGRSAANLYRFDVNGLTYVLRLLPTNSTQAARFHQATIAKNASEIGVGPKVYFLDQEFEGIVMQFIKGRTVQYKDFQNPNNLANIAKLLKQLHRSSVPFPMAHSPFQRFQDFCARGEQNKILFPTNFSKVKAAMQELETLFKRSPLKYVPSHLDLNPLNIMFTGERFWFVDWVNGGMSDPFFDLATFSIFHHLNEEQNLFFLKQYFERDPTESEWNRFVVTQPIRLFVIAAAFLSIEEIPIDMGSKEITKLENYLVEIEKGENNRPHWEIGLIMLKAGLDLIENDKFNKALRNISLQIN